MACSGDIVQINNSGCSVRAAGAAHTESLCQKMGADFISKRAATYKHFEKVYDNLKVAAPMFLDNLQHYYGATKCGGLQVTIILNIAKA